MYVGVLAAIAGEAVLLQSVTLFLYALLVGSMFQIFVVKWEEPHLRRKFGASYEEYCRQVPRWIPRGPRRS